MNIDKLCLYCMNEKAKGTQLCEHCGHTPEDCRGKAHQLEPYTILNGQYLIGRVLGEGGFGITYLCFDLLNEKKVAVKEMYISGRVRRRNTTVTLNDKTEKGVLFYNACKEKFLQEAKALSQLEDKNGVVSILDYFEENATAYIVMEYLEGEDLKSYLARQGGRVSYQEAFSLLRPVMKSMICVNQAGIIHRDISPDNIRCLSSGYIKIMDFGSAKEIENFGSQSIVTLKEGYAPKEQYRPDYKVGPWMDVYSMSATFYRCVTGEKPKSAAVRENNHDLKPFASYGIKVPETVEQVIRKGLALRPEDRYQDMWSLYQALKKVCIGEPAVSSAGQEDSPSADSGKGGQAALLLANPWIWGMAAAWFLVLMIIITRIRG